MRTWMKWLGGAVALFVVVTLARGFYVGHTVTGPELQTYVEDNAVSLGIAFSLVALAILGGVVWGVWAGVTRLGARRGRRTG